MSKKKLIASGVIFVILTLVDTFIINVPITLKNILANVGIALLFLAGMFAEEWFHSRKRKKSMR